MQSPKDDAGMITPDPGEWEPEEITRVPSFPVADIHGHLAKYPEHHEEDKSVDEEPDHNRKHSMLMIALSIFKYTYSSVLLIFQYCGCHGSNLSEANGRNGGYEYSSCSCLCVYFGS